MASLLKDTTVSKLPIDVEIQHIESKIDREEAGE